MTILSNRELKRHEYLAFGLLGVALFLWTIGAWFRAHDRWVPEYPHAMIGVAAVTLFTSLVWRFLAFTQQLLKHRAISRLRERMFTYLGAYTFCILVSATWLIYEQRHLAEIAWMREQGVSVIVLYAILAVTLPWAITVSMWTLFNTRRHSSA